ncbi:MAG: hypothetical protein K6D94_03875 [Clostridiales bacterium]|nr:hypothetical protein [Clostridiales bacterium]
MTRFPIGFWNYTTNQLTAEAVKDWADLGMTMANSPEITDDTDRSVIRGMLDACAGSGIKMILCDHRGLWRGASDDPDGYESRFRSAYEEFGRHPAVLGFHVGDEPYDEKAFADSSAAYRIQLKAAPELTPFLNYLPYWEGQEKTILKAPSFLDWAKRTAPEAGLKILSYDCYTQMNPGEEGVHNYFRNLRMFREAADATGTKPWTTLLSVGHFKYRCPSENDLRWQLSTAVLSGMEGIMWFFIYERECRINYRLPPIDAFGERTETFNWLARTNKYFLHQFGDFFLRAKRVKTVHVGKSYGGYELFQPGATDDLVLDITTSDDVPAVVGFYELDGMKYVAIANNSTTEDSHMSLHVSDKVKSLRQWNFNRQLIPVRELNRKDGLLIGSDWHFPGQIKLYCIEP